MAIFYRRILFSLFRDAVMAFILISALNKHKKKKHKKIFVYFFNFQNYQNLFNPEIKKNKYFLIFLCNEIETRDEFISIFHNFSRIWKKKHYCKTKKEKGFRKKSCSSKTPNLMIMKFHFHEKLFVRLLSSFYNHRN